MLRLCSSLRKARIMHEVLHAVVAGTVVTACTRLYVASRGHTDQAGGAHGAA
jgi:hypothetical protein